MHDHLRDVGRDIAEDPGLPCRLWRWTENAINDLLDGPAERAVRGIKMSLRDYNDIDDYDALGDIRMKRLRLLDTEDFLMERILTKVQSPNLIWLRWRKCPSSGLPSSIFLKNLRVLYVEGRKLETLWENESQAPLQLQELKIEGPLSNIPKSIGQLTHLERIEIGPIYGNGSGAPDTTICAAEGRIYRTSDGFSGTVAPFLTKLPEELCLLQSLKALVLKDCKHIKSLPDSLGNLTNLHHIQLSECCTLEKLPDSFCKLIKLQYLDLNNCTNLTMSSKTLGSISTLRYIDLTSCEKIDLLPRQVAQQRSLEQLRFGGTNVKELPSAIGELSDLEFVGIGGPLHTLPASLGDLRNLMKLSIWGCETLECLPASLGLLTQLTELWVANCPLISELPFITEVNNGTLPRLRNLLLSGLSISKVSFAEGVCSNLRDLQVFVCYNMVEVGTLPNTLTSLEFINCENLWIIDELYVLAKLQALVICGSIQLEELPDIETLVSLRYLDVSGCVELKIIQGLGQLTKLIELDVKGCSELEEVEGIQHCMTLRSLEGAECPKLQWSAEVVEQLRQRCSTLFSINE